MAITINTSDINYSQLFLLGCRGEIENAFYYITPQTTWSKVYFKTLLEKNQISINAEYWILVLQEQLSINTNLSGLNWLIDAGTLIPLRGSFDAKYRVKTAINVLKDYSSTGIDSLMHYRLSKILKESHELDNEEQQKD